MGFLLHIKREEYFPQTTIGHILLNGREFSYTLEDTVRAYGIKVPGATAIPAGRYKVKVTMSSRFKKLMPMIYNQDNGYELIAEGVSFKGLRLHGGNTHSDTEGCVLIAKNRVNKEVIQGSMSDELTEKLIELGGEGEIVIENITA
jgi:hypothetical protein